MNRFDRPLRFDCPLLFDGSGRSTSPRLPTYPDIWPAAADRCKNENALDLLTGRERFFAEWKGWIRAGRAGPDYFRSYRSPMTFQSMLSHQAAAAAGADFFTQSGHYHRENMAYNQQQSFILSSSTTGSAVQYLYLQHAAGTATVAQRDPSLIAASVRCVRE